MTLACRKRWGKIGTPRGETGGQSNRRSEDLVNNDPGWNELCHAHTKISQERLSGTPSAADPRLNAGPAMILALLLSVGLWAIIWLTVSPLVSL
jgi:hypothetical protein